MYMLFVLERGRGPLLMGWVFNVLSKSWEQGTAAGAILETDDSEYAVFADNPFQNKGQIPVSTLHLALSAAVRQTADGRLSQQINDALDGAALDGGMRFICIRLSLITYTAPYYSFGGIQRITRYVHWHYPWSLLIVISHPNIRFRA